MCHLSTYHNLGEDGQTHEYRVLSQNEDGAPRFADAQGVFMYNGKERGNANDYLGIVVVDKNGKATKYAIKRKYVSIDGAMSLDDYKESRISANEGGNDESVSEQGQQGGENLDAPSDEEERPAVGNMEESVEPVGHGKLGNETYKLSDEIDENGRQFVISPEGKLEFGKIDKESGLPSAPILLSEGMITNPATNDGYGLVHIEARHGEQIRKAGYKSVLDFIENVAKKAHPINLGD